MNGFIGIYFHVYMLPKKIMEIPSSKLIDHTIKFPKYMVDVLTFTSIRVDLKNSIAIWMNQMSMHNGMATQTKSRL